MIFVQRIFPKPTPKSITAPFVPWPPVCALHGGRFRKTAKTEPWCCGPIAGDAATQRCARYFHAVLPVFRLTAANFPELVETYMRP